jgi:hypothetical protein
MEVPVVNARDIGRPNTVRRGRTNIWAVVEEKRVSRKLAFPKRDAGREHPGLGHVLGGRFDA